VIERASERLPQLAAFTLSAPGRFSVFGDYQEVMDPLLDVRASFFHVSKRPGQGHELCEDYIQKPLPF
jgi:hypothetical protein